MYNAPRPLRGATAMLSIGAAIVKQAPPSQTETTMCVKAWRKNKPWQVEEEYKGGAIPTWNDAAVRFFLEKMGSDDDDRPRKVGENTTDKMTLKFSKPSLNGLVRFTWTDATITKTANDDDNAVAGTWKVEGMAKTGRNKKRRLDIVLRGTANNVKALVDRVSKNDKANKLADYVWATGTQESDNYEANAQTPTNAPSVTDLLRKAQLGDDFSEGQWNLAFKKGSTAFENAIWKKVSPYVEALRYDPSNADAVIDEVKELLRSAMGGKRQRYFFEMNKRLENAFVERLGPQKKLIGGLVFELNVSAMTFGKY